MFSDEYQTMILVALETLSVATTKEDGDPGPWTAKLCRYLNGLP